MTITDYAAEAASARRTSAKCYRRARQLVRDAERNLKTAKNCDWLATHAAHNGETEEAAQYTRTAKQLRSSAEHYVSDLAPRSRANAREYTAIARRYDELAAREAGE